MEDFDLVAVEQDLDVDLEDELYEDWDGEPYVQAAEIEGAE